MNPNKIIRFNILYNTDKDGDYIIFKHFIIIVILFNQKIFLYQMPEEENLMSIALKIFILHSSGGCSA